MIGGPIGPGQQVDPLHKSTHTDGISPISVWLSRQTQQKTEGCSNINNQCSVSEMICNPNINPISEHCLIDLAGREQCWITWISENSSFIFWPVARLFSRRRLAMCVVGRIKKGTSCVILQSIARIVEAMRKPGNWRPVVDCWPHNHPHYRHSLAQHRLAPPHRPFSHTPAVHTQGKHTKAKLCCSEPFILTAATSSPGFVYSKWAGCVPHCLEVKELGRQHWNKHSLVRTSSCIWTGARVVALAEKIDYHLS